MGHSLGVADNYDRFPEDKLLEEYLKAVPSLTISDIGPVLTKQLSELQISNKDESEMIMAKFKEKENELAALSHKVEELISNKNRWLDIIKIAKEIARDDNGVVDNGGSILDAERMFTISYVDKHDQTRTIRIPIDLVEVLEGEPDQYIKHVKI